LYANLNASALQSILADSEAQLMFVGKFPAKNWESLKKAIPATVKILSMDGYDKIGATSWQKFIQVSTEVIDIQSDKGDIMTYIYTSGTTGAPKGVVHKHRSVINAVIAAAETLSLNRRGNRFVSYLPLSHAAERGLVECGGIYCGATIGFVESMESFTSNVQSLAPTHFFGVPRIWKKFQSKILEQVSPTKLTFLLSIPIISTIIKNKIKRTLGLHKAQVILSGAAPIAPSLMAWFQKLGVTIREAYGLSENFNVISINPADDIRIGTVGRLLENQEVFIDQETHEICQKCDWLMCGYHNKPEETSKAIVDGFLHTGDMGQLSEDGFLTITGRVKDIFKTAKGEYISPAPLEKHFMEMEIVDQVCVMGSKYPQAFIVVILSDLGKSKTKKEIQAQMAKALVSVNRDLMEYQKLKKIIIVQDEWTTENGMLTPSLKIKRNVLSAKYEPLLMSTYEMDELVSWT
jgi:long-subunit acyl-CoA synthetase (AMP-forming)